MAERLSREACSQPYRTPFLPVGVAGVPDDVEIDGRMDFPGRPTARSSNLADTLRSVPTHVRSRGEPCVGMRSRVPTGGSRNLAELT